MTVDRRDLEAEREEILAMSSATAEQNQRLFQIEKELKQTTRGVDAFAVAASALRSLGYATIRAAQASADGADGLSAMSDFTRSVTNAAGAAASAVTQDDGVLHSFANAVGSVIIAIQKSGDAQFKAFRELSSSGLVMDMSDTFANLQGAGYTMAEMGKFTAIMKKNSTMFAALGGSAADGAKQFVDVARSIRESGLEEQYRNMGMSVDDINNSTAQYMKFQQLSGSGRKQTTAELTAGISEYIDEQDRLTKLTGISAEAQNKANEHALAQEQYAAKTAQIQARIEKGGPDAEVAKKEMERNRALISFVAVNGKGHADNLNKVLAGAINDPGYQKFAQNFPNATKAIESGLTDSTQIMQMITQDARVSAKTHAQLAKQGLSDELFGSYSDTANLAGISTDKMTEANEQAFKTQTAQKEGTMDASTKNMAKMNQAQRDVNQDVDSIVNDAVPTMISGTDKLAGMTEQLSKLLGGINISDLLSNLGGGAGGSSSGGSAGSAGGAASGMPAGSAATTESQNKQLLLQEMNAQGVTDPKVRAAMAAVTEGESGFRLQSEIAYDKTSNEGIRTSFGMGSVFGRMSDEELTKLKADPVAFFDYVYGYKSAQGRKYGNTEPGDGYKYRGRGFIGITFKTNYKKYGDLLGIDLVGNPDLANDPKIASKIAVMMMKDGMIAHRENYGQDEFTQVARSIGNANARTEQRKIDAYKRNLQSGQFGTDKTADLSWMTGAAVGDILSGPIDGFMAMLHGTEAVIPMPDGKPIDVQSPGGEGSEEAEQLMAMKMEKMDTLVRGMTTYLRTTDRLLQLQS